MFKDDGSVIHFKKPTLQFSVRENLLVVTGTPETKDLKSMLPDVLKQMGPKQLEHLKGMFGGMDKV